MFKLIKTKDYIKSEKLYAGAIGKNRLAKMEADLAASPTYNPAHISRLDGTDFRYRYKIGAYRVIYSVFEDEVEVLMITLGPRGSVYE